MTSRVRVVVVDYNGGDLTLDCLRSVVATDWPADALEVVLVDNASRQPVVRRVADELPVVRVIESPRNLGFAGGANLGLADLDGIDCVALVNSDVTVPPGWLAPLVAELASDRAVGAVMPKVLLADRFVPVDLSSPTRRRSWLDRRRVGIRVAAARALDGSDLSRRLRHGTGFWGPEWDHRGGPCRWTGNGDAATLFVPDVGQPEVELLLSASKATVADARCGAAHQPLTLGTVPTWHRVHLDAPARDLLHTVGVAVDPLGYGSDIGYLQPDDGDFDAPQDITAWSGAVVAMRTDYLADTGTFDDALFMYYEDVDLSLRGSRRGWRYRMRPDSTARHLHQAAASRSALMALYLSERNRLRVAKRSTSSTRFTRLLAQHVRITCSYAARDIVAPLLSGTRPRWEPTTTRARALAGALSPRNASRNRDPFAAA